MLESLLIIACLGGTGQSCMESGTAYTRYSGIDKVIEKVGQENPELSFAIGSIGLAREKKLYYKVFGPWYHEMNALDGFKTIAWFKKEF